MLLTKPSLANFSTRSSALSSQLAHGASGDGLSADAASATKHTNKTAPLPFSTRSLDRRIEAVISAYCAVDAWPSRPSDSHLTPMAYLRSLKDIPEEKIPETIAQAYAHTCVLLWRSLSDDGGPSFAAAPVPSPALAEQIQRLVWAWAMYPYRLDKADFLVPPASHATTVAALQAQWRSPHIQSALQSATTQLLSASGTVSIQRYPTSWAYLCGCLMYQLLQWNHQLTPETLRELFC
ncbi:MAG: hypothetical protein AB8B99_23750 [Phormidesmis sp.]